jgi:hypothetical protein
MKRLGGWEEGRNTTERETRGMGDPCEIRYPVTIVNFTGQAGRRWKADDGGRTIGSVTD